MRAPARSWARLLTALGALATMSACTDEATTDGVTAQSERRQCFLPAQVNGFSAESDEHVYVTVGTRDVYQLDLVGSCPEVDWSQRIGIRSTGGGSWVCQGLDAELIVPSPTRVQRCAVTHVRQLSEDEVRARREHPRH